MKTLPFLLLTMGTVFSVHAPKSAAFAQATWSGNFHLPAVNGSVKAIAETADAWFYGGDFTQVGAVKANHIVRVDKATGQVTPLGSETQNGVAAFLGPIAWVNSLEVIGTDLYVGGSFFKVSSSTQNAITARNIAKWDTLTSTWMPLGSAAQNGASGAVEALVAAGADLYVGGFLTTVSSSTQNGISASRVAKWNTTTGIWSPLGSAAQNGVQSGSAVYALAVNGSGVYVGGTFSTVSSSTQNAISANYIARWDTATETWSPLGSAAQNGTSTIVDCLAVKGTDLFVGGSFSAVSSSSQNAMAARNVAKWDTLANSWSVLGSAAQNGTGTSVKAFAVRGDDLYVGGVFNSVSSATQNGLSVNMIAKWDTIAGTWSALGSTARTFFDLSVDALAVSGAEVRVGGNFQSIGDLPNTSGVAKWSADTEVWSPAVAIVPGDGIAGTVYAVLDTGTMVYVGGSFTFAGSVRANNVACWNKATGSWSALGSPTQNGTNAGVRTLCAVGADVYVGGDFTSVSSSSQSGISANRIAKWSPSSGTWYPLGSEVQNGAEGSVGAMIQMGTDLYVAGGFLSVNSSTQSNLSARRVARWETGTGTWSVLGSAGQNGTNQNVTCLAVIGTDLYAGGIFGTVSSASQNGISAQNIARWDTVNTTWSPLGSAAQNGTSAGVDVMRVMNSTLYVGGSFISVSSATQDAISTRRVAGWDPATGLWSPLGSALQNGTSGRVSAMTSTATDLYIGGFFGSVSSSSQNNLTANDLAKWNESTGTWAPIGSATQNGTNQSASALAVGGTSLYVGGDFTSLSSETQNAVSSSRFGIYDPIPVPDIQIEGPVGEIRVSGGAPIPFGTQTVNGSVATTIRFRISNTGLVTLGGLGASLGGTAESDFAISALPPATLAAGASFEFDVLFDAQALGERSATLTIVSQDPDESSFLVPLSGTGLTEQEAWRLQYFQTTDNLGDAADGADPDGDGENNLFEFVAGLDPNDPDSKFLMQMEPVTGHPEWKAIVFSPRLEGRTYSVQYRTSLTTGQWTALTNFNLSDDGQQRTVIDLDAALAPKFYRVKISQP